MKKLFLGLVLALCSTFCGVAHSDNTVAWITKATDYASSGPVAPGMRPAVFATLTMISTEQPSVVLGKTPDRTAVWYAHGELTVQRDIFLPYFYGAVPLSINYGDGNPPFSAKSRTMKMTVNQQGGVQMLYQNEGRNFGGKGYQTLPLSWTTYKDSDNTLILTGSINYFGPKMVTLALTKGAVPLTLNEPMRKAVGARYRISPSFVVTNSSDGAANNTVEVSPDVHFSQNGKELGNIVKYQEGLGKGARMSGDPFEMVVLDSDPASKNLKVTGKIADIDGISDYDVMWKAEHSLNIPFYATKGKLKNNTFIMRPDLAFNDDDAQGNVEIKIEKIEDIY